MKNIYLLIFLSFFAVILKAQIGINTESPLNSSIWHVDAKSDTSGSNNITDDIIVTPQGYLGVGTHTPPSNLTINGTFRMNDGNQNEGHILVSNSDGIASWEPVAVNRYIVWSITGSQTFNEYDISLPIFDSTLGISTLQKNEIPNSSLSGGQLTLPAGRYLLSVNGDLRITEYGTIDLMINGSVYQSFMAANSLGGSSIIVSLSTPAILELNITFIEVDTLSYTKLPITTNYLYSTTIIQLQSILNY